MIEKYLRRPVEVEAAQFVDFTSAHTIIKWLGSGKTKIIGTNFWVETFQGIEEVYKTNWVVKTASGAVCVLDDTYFKKLYSPTHAANLSTIALKSN